MSTIEHDDLTFELERIEALAELIEFDYEERSDRGEKKALAMTVVAHDIIERCAVIRRALGMVECEVRR